MTIYVTSDLHLGHANILKYTDRHKFYSNIKDHDESIIETINKYVKSKDTLYILGDITFKSPEQLFYRLKCNKIVIVPGNHDRWIKEKHSKEYTSIDTNEDQQIIITDLITELKDNLNSFVMSHYPLARWNKGHYGSYMLHGHCHGSFNTENTNCRRLDVGWDNFYKPITLDQIIQIKKSVPTSVKHHNNNNENDDES